MNHFFIGPEHKKIFVSRMQARKQAATKAVLLFYPFGQEYMRAHKAFRQLATLLTRKGFDVFRFDYLGTGDSYGKSEDALFSDYVNSAKVALAHIESNYSYAQIDLAGLRLGALVAATCFGQNPQLKRCILWDPIATGQRFNLDCMAQKDSDDASGNTIDNSKTWNIHGYALTPAFRESIAAISIANLGFTQEQSIELITSYENPDASCIRSLSNAVNLTEEVVPPANDWSFVDMVGSILIPSQIIKAIVTSLSSTTTSQV